MKRGRWIWILLLFITGLGFVYLTAVFLEQTRGKAILKGIRRIRRGEAESVSLSPRVTRVLSRNDQRAEEAFRRQMGRQGWNFLCYYGRSALYRRGGEEVLVRKTPLVGGVCIYELLDEAYLRHMKSDIREVA